MFGIVLILIESSKSQTRSHRLWPIRTKPINTMNQSEHKVKKKKNMKPRGENARKTRHVVLVLLLICQKSNLEFTLQFSLQKRTLG